MNVSTLPGDCPAINTSANAVSGFRFPLVPVVAAITMALLATTVSLGIAAYAAGLRGGTPVQKTMIIALASVAVLYVHLVAVYWHFASAPGRIACGALWVVAVVVVMIGQMTFFVVSQRDAGNQRAAALPIIEARRSDDASRGRSLSEIADDRVQVVADLARIEARRCPGICRGVSVRTATLNARLAALDAETAEAKRREAEEDRRTAQAERDDASRARLRADPVAPEIASWFGTTEARLDLVQAAVLAVVLEGSAIVGWLMVVRVWPRSVSREPVASSRALGAAIVAPAGEVSPDVAAVDAVTPADVPIKSEDDEVLDKIHVEVLANRLKPTQAAIRGFLGCGQATAGHYARLYRARFNGMSA